MGYYKEGDKYKIVDGKGNVIETYHYQVAAIQDKRRLEQLHGRELKIEKIEETK